MSGASSRARPRGREGSATRWTLVESPVEWSVRTSPGRILVSVNHWASSGWWTSTGDVVVGRMTPGVETGRPTKEFTKVDFPAPVEPPTTASSGASMVSRREMT